MCLFDGEQVVWPAAPVLRGITMQLVQAGLTRAGVPSTTRPVHRDDLPKFRSAVLMNSITPGQPLAGIETVELPDHKHLLAIVRHAYLATSLNPSDDGPEGGRRPTARRAGRRSAVSGR